MRGAYQSKNESRPGIRNAIVSKAPSAPEIITASSTALSFWIACAQSTPIGTRKFQLAGSPVEEAVECRQGGNNDRDSADGGDEHHDER